MNVFQPCPLNLQAVVSYDDPDPVDPGPVELRYRVIGWLFDPESETAVPMVLRGSWAISLPALAAEIGHETRCRVVDA